MRAQFGRLSGGEFAILGVGCMLAIALGLLASVAAPTFSVRDGLRLSGGAAPWVALGCAFVLALPTLLVWRSRWNVLAVTQLGLFLAGYFVPLAFLGTLDEWPATV